MKIEGPIIVSACLLGDRCRYDGAVKPCGKVTRLAQEVKVIPVCPEVLGGLSIPRSAAERRRDQVVTCDGRNVTKEFIQGAQKVLEIAKAAGVTVAVLKARSPSCGSGQIYDGTFSKKLIDGDGVFAQICKENGIQVYTEDNLD